MICPKTRTAPNGKNRKKDLGLVYWDYYHDDTRTYEKMLDIHAQLSDNVILQEEILDLERNFPQLSLKTYACTKAALYLKKYNIKEVLVQHGWIMVQSPGGCFASKTCTFCTP